MRHLHSYRFNEPGWLAGLVREVEELNNLLAPLRLSATGTEPGVGCIDEVALLMLDGHDYEKVARRLIAAGTELRRVASDSVDVWPHGSCYDVDYSFFHLNTRLPLRIELMRITDGTSPLHAPYRDFGQFDSKVEPILPVVHYSFKCADAVWYSDVKDVLKTQGAYMVQECHSHYGDFSYWASNALTGEKMVYVKPRVNLRDAPKPLRHDPDATTILGAISGRPVSPAPQGMETGR